MPMPHHTWTQDSWKGGRIMSISEQAERVRFAIYTHLAEAGSVPAPATLAAHAGITTHELPELMAELAQAHHLMLDDHGEIVLAHPFATRSFRFSVMGPDTLWWGGCAWDSFAIPHLVPGLPGALVATTCQACDTPHAWTVTKQAPPAGTQVAHFLTPTDRIWPDATHACENQQIFCSESCVDDWLERTGNRRGYVMPLDTLWRLAQNWYNGRLQTPYERREPVDAAEYFENVGLRGPFWGLPGNETTP